jgi:hypothetical protein
VTGQRPAYTAGMHGTLSLAVLVAACAGLAGWIGYLLVRLYRACPAVRATAALSAASDPAGSPDGGGPGEAGGPPESGGPAEEHVATPQSVA